MLLYGLSAIPIACFFASYLRTRPADSCEKVAGGMSFMIFSDITTLSTFDWHLFPFHIALIPINDRAIAAVFSLC